MKAGFAVSALAALVLLPVGQARAQATGGAAPADPNATKVGIVNFRSAIFATAEGKQALAELQSQLTPRTQELENLRKQIQDLQTKLQQGERTLSDVEKARLQRQGENMARLFQRKQDDLQEDANSGQQIIAENIGPKMYDVIEKYAKENGYGLILDYSVQANPVLYGDGKSDVTQDVVRLYDQANPVKGGAAPAQQQPPAGQRPQPGQPRPPAQQPPKPPQQ